MRNFNKVAVAGLSTTLLIIQSAGAYAVERPPTDLPPVEAVKPFMPICQGMICEGLRQSLQVMDWDPMEVEIFREGGGGSMTKEQFCKEMRNHPPEGCDPDNPPSVPNFDPGWTSSGCGDGSFKSLFAEAMASLILPDVQRDLDNPLPGISFLGACRMHDSCYTTQMSKGGCDTAFYTMLRGACGAGSPTYADQCQELAAGFHGAVALQGRDAYAAAQQDRECAAWVEDLEANKCE